MSKTKVYKRVELGVYHAPDEVLRLAEDIVRLNLVQRILGQIDARNISRKTDRDMRVIRANVAICQRAADQKLKQLLNT